MSFPVTPEISIKLKRLCYNLHVLRTCSEMKSILLALLFCLAFTCQLQAMNIKNATLVLLKDAPKKVLGLSYLMSDYVACMHAEDPCALNYA